MNNDLRFKNPWAEDYDNTLAFWLILEMLTPLGFEDATWHNNTCPSVRWQLDDAHEETEIVVWIDYQNQTLSENPNDGTRCVFLSAYFAMADDVGDLQLGFEAHDLTNIYTACKMMQQAINRKWREYHYAV